MWRIAVCLSIVLVAANSAGAQGVPPTNWKTLGAALDSLGQDSTLSDSARLRIKMIGKSYKNLVAKLKDSAGQARRPQRKDTVVLVRKDSPVIKYVAVGAARDTVKVVVASSGKDTGVGWPWVLLGGLFLLGSGGLGWWLFLAGRKPDVQQTSEHAVTEVKEIETSSAAPEDSATTVASNGEIRKAVFTCELLMTAGPRKKFMNEENADKDLGEDVCGCVVRGDRAGVWLLDGTSDQFCLRNPLTGKEYFSSRLLAQDIGDRLREEYTRPGQRDYVLDRIMTEAIEAVRQAWVLALQALPEEERILLTDNIRTRNCPECSSTLLAAVLSLDGRASAYRSGDSKLLLFQRGEDFSGPMIPSSASLTTKNPESNDRIFFRIVLNKADGLDIVCNKPSCEVIYEERVNALIAYSDGIGPVSEEALKNEYGAYPADVRRRVGSDQQGTADDKSICIVRIEEDIK